MNKIYTYPLEDNFILRLADFIEENYLKQNKDLSRLAVVFGGKRPVLFLKRELSHRIGESFFPPAFFSIDEFVEYTVRKKERLNRISDMDLCYLIFQQARICAASILKGRETFSTFLPWAREVLSFMEQIDLEDVSAQALRNIELHAEMGFSTPKDINVLLEHIIALREGCHEILDTQKRTSRGFEYLKASRLVGEVDFKEFDQICFCGFFHLHKTERQLIKNLYERNQAVLFFQGDETQWPVLKKTAAGLADHPNFTSGIGQPGGPSVPPNTQLHFYAGFDTHSQVCLVREILKKIPNLKQTVIVLPKPEHVIPLLSEISSVVSDFNVSLGYPLMRSSFYSLFDFVFKAQLSRKQNQYYARDYLKALRHPFVKSLEFSASPSVTRVLIHKIEEILTGQEKTSISGSLFVRLEEIEDLRELFELSNGVLKKMGIEVSTRQLKGVLENVHHLLFYDWKKVEHFHGFAGVLEKFLDVFVNQSSLSVYPLNLKIAVKIFDLKEEFKALTFSQEKFSMEDIFKIFTNRLEKEIVAFSGSPLKGLQILGLLETRSLNFEHVIVMDVNEGVLPHLRVYEPLIPREVMIRLNLDRVEREEEIQRYQLMRLISSAKEVHLVYEESRTKEKSRFLEELIWNQQKAQNSLDVLKPLKASFQLKMSSKKTIIKKTPEVLKFLKEFRYSASSVNTYVRCPLRFYYNYVLGLNEKEDLLEEPEHKEIGIFIHGLLEEIFKPWMGRLPVVDEDFYRHFFKKFEERFAQGFEKTMKSDSFLVKRVLEVRLGRFLEKEAERQGLRDVREVITVEESFYDQIPLTPGQINFIYKVDRIDRLADKSLLIVDYKTGSNDPMPKAVDKIKSMALSRETIKNAVKSFQIPLYFYYFDKQYPQEKINAVFYNLRTLEIDLFLDEKMTFERSEVIQVFLRALDFVLTELLNPDISFKPDDSDARYCASCPFFYVCR